MKVVPKKNDNESKQSSSYFFQKGIIETKIIETNREKLNKGLILGEPGSGKSIQVTK